MNTLALYNSRISLVFAFLFLGAALAHVVMCQFLAAVVFAVVAILWACLYVAFRSSYDQFLGCTKDDQ